MISEMPPFGKKLLIRLSECFLCIMFIRDFGISNLGFDGEILFLITQVTGPCLPFYFSIVLLKYLIITHNLVVIDSVLPHFYPICFQICNYDVFSFYYRN